MEGESCALAIARDRSFSTSFFLHQDTSFTSHVLIFLKVSELREDWLEEPTENTLAESDWEQDLWSGEGRIRDTTMWAFPCAKARRGGWVFPSANLSFHFPTIVLDLGGSSWLEQSMFRPWNLVVICVISFMNLVWLCCSHKAMLDSEALCADLPTLMLI